MPPMNRAPSGRYLELSTDLVTANRRREFWRDTALNRSDADFPADTTGREFSASVRGYVGDRAELREGKSGPVILRRDAARCRRDGGDEILLSAIVSADAEARYRSNSTAFLVPAGRFMVNDMAVPFEIEMPCYRSINFRLPRASVASGVLVRPGWLSERLLPETPLGSLLFGHLVRLADQLPAMDDASREVALDATANFAIATLRQVAQADVWEAGARWDGLWLAAERFIERNLDRAELNPEMLARALRCSRTQVYRLFAHHGLAVMDYIRDRRLGRCRDMLSDPACVLSIAEIASLCGMDNPSAFSRGFRRRYGCAPGDMRREAHRIRG